MTYEGAKVTILLEYCATNSCGDCDNCVLGKAIEALNKQIPKKPVLMCDGSFNGYITYRCPSCGARVHLQSYCMQCGQAIKSGSGMEADSIIIDEVAHDTENED